MITESDSAVSFVASRIYQLVFHFVGEADAEGYISNLINELSALREKGPAFKADPLLSSLKEEDQKRQFVGYGITCSRIVGVVIACIKGLAAVKQPRLADRICQEVIKYIIEADESFQSIATQAIFSQAVNFEVTQFAFYLWLLAPLSLSRLGSLRQHFESYEKKTPSSVQFATNVLAAHPLDSDILDTPLVNGILLLLNCI